MTPDGQTTAQLATFDPPLAEAVLTVLSGAGFEATLEPLGHDEVEVRVPAARRAEALAVLADRMEEIHDLVAEPGTATVTPVPLTDRYDQTDDEDGPPIFLERLRRMSLGVVVLLAPLLVISLSGVNLPIGYALALFVVGLVAVVYWRNRNQA